MGLKIKKPGESLGKKRLKLSKKGKIMVALGIVLLIPLLILTARIATNAVADANAARELEANVSPTIQDALGIAKAVAQTAESRELIRNALRERDLSDQATKTLYALDFIISNEDLTTTELDSLRGFINRIGFVIRNYIGG